MRCAATASLLCAFGKVKVGSRHHVEVSPLTRKNTEQGAIRVYDVHETGKFCARTGA